MSGHPLETPQYGFQATDFDEGGWILSWLGDQSDVVVGSKAVPADLFVLGIALPVTVHKKLIFVLSDIQSQAFFPHALLILFHDVRCLAPIVKVAHQGNLGGSVSF